MEVVPEACWHVRHWVSGPGHGLEGRRAMQCGDQHIDVATRGHRNLGLQIRFME